MIVFFGGLDEYANQTHLCWINLHLILMLVNKCRCLGSSGWVLGLILKKSSTLQFPKFQVIIWFFWCQASDYVYIVQAVKPCTVFVFSRDRSSKLFEPRIFFSGRFQGKIGPHQKILFLLVFKRPGCWLKSFLGCFWPAQEQLAEAKKVSTDLAEKVWIAIGKLIPGIFPDDKRQLMLDFSHCLPHLHDVKYRLSDSLIHLRGFMPCL